MAMSSLAMETHEFIKELTEAGLTEHQSEVIARHQSLIISENLATKQDMESLKEELFATVVGIGIIIGVVMWVMLK